MNVIGRLNINLEETAQAKKLLLSDLALLEVYRTAVKRLLRCFEQGGRVYIAGTGSSATEAQRLATEFATKLAFERRPLPAEALAIDGSMISAIGNQYGYDEIYARQLVAKASEKDVFLAITRMKLPHFNGYF